MRTVNIVFCIFFLHLFCMFPVTVLGQFSNAEVDSRITDWSSITRLALEGGLFPPSLRPVTNHEINSILTIVKEQSTGNLPTALLDEEELKRLLFLLECYPAYESSLSENPGSIPEQPFNMRISGRVIAGYSELGNPLPFEGMLSFAPGHNTFFEPAAEFTLGDYWYSVNFRMGGRIAQGGTQFDWAGGDSSPLTWPHWPIASGKAEVRSARLKGGAWNGKITRAVIGKQSGKWAISAGWDYRRTGPGLTGSLNLDYQGRPFPAITVRRTSPFRWTGIMTHLAPDQFLLRTGLLSSRTVRWDDIYGEHTIETHPYFFQWFVGYNVTSWFRTNFTHTVMAAARDGSLWPDLLQINFPLIGTTWRELDSGPITDRIFAVQMEFRWRNAPWPLLPSTAGRLFWDYGGTDFLPSGPGGLVPQISIPASVAGFELLSPRWDFCFEYAELQHTKGLWYSNGGYEEGYSNDQWLIGHPLGGSGESLTGLIRIRPAGWGILTQIEGKSLSWGMPSRTPGTGEQFSVGLTIRRTPLVHTKKEYPESSPLIWEVTTQWNREKADPWGNLNHPPADSEVQQNWWSIIFKIRI